MFNLLPEEEKKQILSEYSVRRLIVALLFLFVVGLVSVVAIFPAFVLSNSQVTDASNSVGRVRSASILSEADQLNAKLSQANAKLLALRPPKTEIDTAALFRTVIQYKTKNIRITGFTFVQGKGSALGKLSIVGIAYSRTDLSGFVEKLQKDSLFKKVNLPVSSFTKDQNADFILDVTGNF